MPRSCAGPVDPNRVGIVGWSYGGYMTMWAVTQRTGSRPRSRRRHRELAKLLRPEQDRSRMLPFFGASVYDDPEIYARSSPIAFIEGEDSDARAARRTGPRLTPQGYEFWHAPKALA